MEFFPGLGKRRATAQRLPPGPGTEAQCHWSRLNGLPFLPHHDLSTKYVDAEIRQCGGWLLPKGRSPLANAMPPGKRERIAIGCERACGTPAASRQGGMSDEDQRLSIDRLGPGDLDAAIAIQRGAYPGFLVEEADAFLSRITLASSYSLAARCGGVLIGYLLAHGWPRQSPAPIGAILTDRAPSDVLFIHDLAVSSRGRGLGVGRRLVAPAFELAFRDGLRRAELIAVEGADGYWRSLGFAEQDVSPALRAKLASYGDRACWMERDIPPCLAGAAKG